MFRIYLIILNIEKQLGNDVKRRQAFNQRFLKNGGLLNYGKNRVRFRFKCRK